MSENAKQMSGPDLAAGVAITDIADGAMVQGHVATSCSPSARHAPTITGRSPRA